MSDEFLDRSSPAALVVSVVNQGHGAKVVCAAREAHAFGGFIVYGRGTASDKILERLGITKHREVVFSIALFHKIDRVIEKISATFRPEEENTGIVFAVSIDKFSKDNIRKHLMQKIKHAKGITGDIEAERAEEIREKVEGMLKQFNDEKKNAQDKCDSEVIIVKMANGYAQEVMDCARKAGAKGGTILHGRIPMDASEVKFFNITIEPEGDILFMLVAKEISQQVLEAIAKEHGPLTPAHAMGFVVPALKIFPE